MKTVNVSLGELIEIDTKGYDWEILEDGTLKYQKP
jgi:hypothetical protein